MVITGNLIVGYNEGGTVASSHSIIVGSGISSEGYSNLVTGFGHEVRGFSSAAIGTYSRHHLALKI